MQHSVRQTLIFALALCVGCSILVSSIAVALRERQEENRRVDEQKNVLEVAGLVEEGEKLSREEIQRRFAGNLKPRVVNLETGEYAEDVDPLTYDQRRASTDPESSRPAPENPARVRRLPRYGRVFLIQTDGEVEGIIVPVEGYGLWSTLYGYLALAPDLRTILGITFYEHGETAGLGGEVDNPRWKALWPGRLAFDESWVPKVAVKKGAAGPVEQDPYHVDGLSGSTLTSNGVTNLIHFWLGDHGFGPYLARRRTEKGT